MAMATATPTRARRPAARVRVRRLAQPGGPSRATARRGGSARPATAPKGTAGKVKPRWNKGKKDAAKVAQRGPDRRPQRAAAVAG